MGATTGAPARDEALLKFLALRGKYRRAALLLAEARRVERGDPPGPPEEVAASELEASRRWRPARRLARPCCPQVGARTTMSSCFAKPDPFGVMVPSSSA